jgi:hypothetical protein
VSESVIGCRLLKVIDLIFFRQNLNFLHTDGDILGQMECDDEMTGVDVGATVKSNNNQFPSKNTFPQNDSNRCSMLFSHMI